MSKSPYLPINTGFLTYRGYVLYCVSSAKTTLNRPILVSSYCYGEIAIQKSYLSNREVTLFISKYSCFGGCAHIRHSQCFCYINAYYTMSNEKINSFS